MSKNLNEVLNYMKQYVENIYEHDSEPMLTWKDLKLVLDEIERLKKINEEHQILNGMIRKELQQKENIIKEVREYIEKEKAKLPLGRNDFTCEMVYSDEVILANELLEILDKENK